MSDAPEFTRSEDARGVLWICRYRGQIGAARQMSKGEQDARDRAFAQAREKAGGSAE